jgi:hypothetical protein
MLETMEQHTKSLNSKTQIELLCSSFVNHPLHLSNRVNECNDMACSLWLNMWLNMIIL